MYYVEPGDKSISYQDNICNVVETYLLRAVSLVLDFAVDIKIFNPFGSPINVSSPQKLDII